MAASKGQAPDKETMDRMLALAIAHGAASALKDGAEKHTLKVVVFSAAQQRQLELSGCLLLIPTCTQSWGAVFMLASQNKMVFDTIGTFLWFSNKHMEMKIRWPDLGQDAEVTMHIFCFTPENKKIMERAYGLQV